MDRTEREQLLSDYENGFSFVEGALKGASAERLDARPDPGEWTAREIVHHLADSEMTSAIRLRRLLTEDDPQIVGYDQEAFARALHYDRPLEGSLIAFRGARESTVPLLRALGDDEWARAGTHTESGRYSVETWLRIYAAHGRDHAEQIRRALSG